jgi:UDP-N-acetylglucosamine:LPS N-acetylglucosamine transferase
MWGSQWSKKLIEVIKSILEKNNFNNLNFFIIWWTLNNQNIFSNFKNVYFQGFLKQEELIELYRKIDVSITRWSATSLAEQDQFDIKKIIIPLPYTWWNHQYYNALEYKKKWDIVLSQLDTNFEEQLLNNIKKLSQYRKEKNKYRNKQDNKQIILDTILQIN